ncbi:MAG: ATP phosphoribosyltransferase regulatory subunit [Rhodobacteraceae bacterium]|jgi:ATP phosphoribosyltransferase regulatory subunit|nr:ATP phosphoribosyltransferase regulatory subunit [uncultured Defluviimonas sp.]MCB2124659.1 ATP phosphoribosyltransferase regulatory subunit [Paracoccaceae bacterium]MCC0069708.1 ATP phosphoribosyltransferase regulatory subunit [Paracoccaceae bacterium]
MAERAGARAEAERLMAAFRTAGAVPVEADILQPAEVLLDLYGEDIRARAYVTNDPLRGEMMLRPDFTVPVVQMHMSDGAEPARYCYMGEVFRKQEHLTFRKSEYFQVGYEVFDRADPVAADAEVFALIADLIAPLNLRAVTGDLAILTAAVRGLKTLESRKAALLRHIWRPRRFTQLLDRFGGRTPVPETRARLLASLAAGQPPGSAPPVGLRSEAEIAARLKALQEDAAAAPIAAEEVARLEDILNFAAKSPAALTRLRESARDMPAIAPAVGRMAARLDALAAKGIDIDNLDFEASHGRTTLEYYDGFVFSFHAADPDLPPVASGGRYDALTTVLGQGRSIPAVGGVIRPGIVADLKGEA